MTDTTPNPGPGDRALIERRLKSAFQTDPMDRLLQDYRPMTRADVLRFDVHQTGEPGQPGKNHAAVQDRLANDSETTADPAGIPAPARQRVPRRPYA